MGFRSFIGLFRSEQLKISRSRIWAIIIASPLLAVIIGSLVSLDKLPTEAHYLFLQTVTFSLHALLLLPIMTAILSATVCRYEHEGGGWKSLLSLPTSRMNVYLVKFIIVALLLAVTQLLMLVAFGIALTVQGIPGGLNLELTLPAIISGWVACLPLAALQLWVSIGWSSFGAALAINVVFTLPNILIVNSEQFGPYYPWAQPAFGMIVSEGGASFSGLTLPMENLFITVGGSFLFFFIGGLLYLKRKEV
ncbi:ABC transporter permease [Paenibacillus sp. N1-5-1-14]|uniref:ABC transporter permease n=1 Tax=Paenibacillus radicibacter TaxID=2972488 RepID=UPI0021594463|nr:ABC transporter permease [Paenibacillus radicibacter]MCR8645130.1 ABC transporter permease [Paenibacillus radicibacter]